jgi:hypothetical protein
MSRAKKAWINGIFLIVTLVINTLGAVGVINGLNQKQISDMYSTLITPSPSTFSIWSLIYSLMLISIIVMIIKKDDAYYNSAVDKITVLFWISCIFNVAWIVSFSFIQVELSVLFILCFLVTLSLICMQLIKIQDKKRWLLPLTFGLYTGWLFIATVVNIAAALVKLKWDGFGISSEIWAIIILAVAVFLVIVVLSKLRNAAFPLPIAWAFFGIYQFLGAAAGSDGNYTMLKIVALIGMVVLIGMAAIQLYRNHYALLPEPAGTGQPHSEK